MIEYYADKNLNKKLHSQGLHIIQSPIESYVKPAGKSRKITRSITDTDEYFITTYFVLPTIIIMIITGIIVPIPWEDTILSWGNIMWVCLLALIAPLLYMLIVTPLIVVLDLAGKSLKITPKPQKKYAIKTKKQQLLNNYSKPLQLISKYNKNGMLEINDLVNQTVEYSFELLEKREQEKSPQVISAYNQTLSKTIKKLEDTINENVIIARESENYVLEQEKSIQQQKKGIDAVSYTHLTLPTTARRCRSRWSPYH